MVPSVNSISSSDRSYIVLDVSGVVLDGVEGVTRGGGVRPPTRDQGEGGEQDVNSMGCCDYQAIYQEEQHTPAPIVMEEGADLGVYFYTQSII